MPKRHFVALNRDGTPAFQRTSDRAVPYLSATGGSFSKDPPSGSDLRVIQVAKPLVWIARAPVPTGCAVKRSGSGAPGSFYIRYKFIANDGRESERTTWYYSSLEEFGEQNQLRATYGRYEIIESGPATIEIKNWPQQAVQS